MFGLVVRFDLVEGAAGAFDALVEETLAQIRKVEPRTLVYACHEVQDDPRARIFYELYEDEQAFENHEEQAHVKRFLRERERFLAAPPRVEFFNLQRDKGITAA